MPLLMTDFYAPQLQAGQIQAQKDTHQMQLAKIASLNREQEQRQANIEAAKRIFAEEDKTKETPSPLAEISRAIPEDTPQTILPQIAQQNKLAKQQETMGKFLATTGQLQASDDAFKSARDTRKAAEDLQLKMLTEQKKKADQVSSIFGTVTDQESLDTAREMVTQVDPQAASKMPTVFTPQVGTRFKQVADSSLTRSQQIDNLLKIQKDKELQDYRKDRLEEQRQSRLDRNANQEANRELRKMVRSQGVKAKTDSYTKDANAYTAEVTNIYKNVQKDIAKINQKVRTKDIPPEVAKESIEELQSDYHRNIEATAEKYRARGVNIPQLYKGEAKALVSNSGKPANMSDADWTEYQAYVKAQGGK